MRFFARINQIREVIDVISCDSEEYIDTLPGTWIETWEDNSYRKNYAGVGYTYDYFRDAFIPPQTYPSWILNELTCRWEAPVPYPTPECFLCYYWDEAINNWVETIPK